MPKLAGSSTEPLNTEGANSQRDFLRIASLSTALAFGVVLGSVEALRRDPSGFAFKISVGTFVAFAIGLAIGVVYWKIVTLNATGNPSLLRRVASFFLLLGGSVAFLYPLRFLPGEKLPEVFEGLATAAVALSLIGFMLRTLQQFFDQDEMRTEVGEKARPGTDPLALCVPPVREGRNS